MSLFPNVPFAPGVPPLPRDPFALVPAVLFLTRDVIALLTGIFIGPQWGLFLNGIPVIDADSVISIDFKKAWRIADYPVEQGAFESYDKVLTPFTVGFRYATAGSEFDRQQFLQSIDNVARSLTLFDAVTPEAIYEDVSVSHYDYRRTATNGVGLLMVDVYCTQVRLTATAAFSNTKTPGAAGNVDGGNVQATPATPPQEAQIPAIQ